MAHGLLDLCQGALHDAPRTHRIRVRQRLAHGVLDQGRVALQGLARPGQDRPHGAPRLLGRQPGQLCAQHRRHQARGHAPQGLGVHGVQGPLGGTCTQLRVSLQHPPGQGGGLVEQPRGVDRVRALKLLRQVIQVGVGELAEAAHGVGRAVERGPRRVQVGRDHGPHQLGIPHQQVTAHPRQGAGVLAQGQGHPRQLPAVHPGQQVLAQPGEHGPQVGFVPPQHQAPLVQRQQPGAQQIYQVGGARRVHLLQHVEQGAGQHLARQVSRGHRATAQGEQGVDHRRQAGQQVGQQHRVARQPLQGPGQDPGGRVGQGHNPTAHQPPVQAGQDLAHHRPHGLRQPPGVLLVHAHQLLEAVIDHPPEPAADPGADLLVLPQQHVEVLQQAHALLLEGLAVHLLGEAGEEGPAHLG